MAVRRTSGCVPNVTQSTREPSGWAVGWTYFAATMMGLVGAFHALTGLVAIIDDEFFVATPNYVLQFDATLWGWIHLIVGIAVAITGGYLLTGRCSPEPWG